MPVNTRSRGYRKKPGVEPPGSPRATPISPGVYLEPEEDLPDYSPTEATPSSAVVATIAQRGNEAARAEQLKEAAEARRQEKQRSIVNDLLSTDLPSLTKNGVPFSIEKSNPVLADFLHKTISQGPSEEEKLPPTPRVPQKVEPTKPLSTAEAVKAFEEQGASPAIAKKNAQNPQVVEQLEIGLSEGFGNIPRKTEGGLKADHKALLAAAQQKQQKSKQGKKVQLPNIEGFEHQDQKEFAQWLSHYSGIPPKLAGEWVKQEGGGYSNGGEAGPQNWLGVGYPAHPTSFSESPYFSGTPQQAAKATAEWMEGKIGGEYDYQAAPSIQGIPKLAKSGASEEEIRQYIEGPSAWGTGAINTAGTISVNGSTAGEAGAMPSMSSGPVPVPKGPRGKFFVNEGAHLRFVPTFAHHLEKLAKLSGEPVHVNEGFRTPEEQAKLVAEGYPAAPVGSSEHEKGLAADVELTDHQRELLSAAGLDLPVPGEDWHVQLSEPAAIEKAAAESATPVPGIAAAPSPVAPMTSLPSVAPTPEVTPSAGGGVIPSAAEMLGERKAEAAEPDRPSLANQLLFGGGENESPVNALLNSPLPSFGSPGTSEALSNEDLLKLLLERA
jgi:hypothetical protein